jgi:U3 small nucleolar RNA-associated protein 7
MCTSQVETPYLRHKHHRPINQIAFAPYEDVLGIGHLSGFSSILVPGAGEPNFDAFESNPYQSKKQRREAEVKALLEKIQPELITLDPAQVAKVDTEAIKEKLAEKKKLLYVHPRRVEFEPRKRHKSKGGTAKMADIKAGVREEKKRRFLKRQRTQQILEQQKEKAKKDKGGTGARGGSGGGDEKKVKREATDGGLDNFDPLKRFRKKKKPIRKPESDAV